MRSKAELDYDNPGIQRWVAAQSPQTTIIQLGLPGHRPQKVGAMTATVDEAKQYFGARRWRHD
ncbi:hypothetical protein KAM341_41170 [Aeromonas caviae]|nr:hypothetical protein KAM341_41170 [Aeromonas caviae]